MNKLLITLAAIMTVATAHAEQQRYYTYDQTKVVRAYHEYLISTHRACKGMTRREVTRSLGSPIRTARHTYNGRVIDYWQYNVNGLTIWIALAGDYMIGWRGGSY